MSVLEKALQSCSQALAAKLARRQELTARRGELRESLDALAAEEQQLQQRAQSAEEPKALARQSGQPPPSQARSRAEQVEAEIRDLERRIWVEQLSAAEERRLTAEIARLTDLRATLAAEDQAGSAAGRQLSGTSLLEQAEELRRRKGALAREYHTVVTERQGLIASIPLQAAERADAQRRLEEKVAERRRQREQQERQRPRTVARSSSAAPRQRDPRPPPRPLTWTERVAAAAKWTEHVATVDAAGPPASAPGPTARGKQQQAEASQQNAAEKRPQDPQPSGPSDKPARGGKDEEHAVEGASMDAPPCLAELPLFEQALVFCRNNVPRQQEVAEEPKRVKYNNPKGSKILVPKEKRSEDFLVIPTKPRRHEGKTSRRAPTSKGRRTHFDGSKPIVHTADSLELFDKLGGKLGFSTPLVAGDVPAIMADLETKLAAHAKEKLAWEERCKARESKKSTPPKGEGGSSLPPAVESDGGAT